ncbi:mariner Mos1 transposase [Trichonephila clavipes]|nr:mariner Mos1 transposase [Trichonephila clavipes]
MNESSIRKWCIQFKNGRTNVHDEEKSLRPGIVTDELVAKVDEKIREIRRFIITELSLSFPQVSRTWLLQIVTQKLGYRNFCARWVQKLCAYIYTDHHKGQRIVAALTFLEAYDRHGDSLLDRIVTGDETWDRQGVLLINFLERGAAINSERYCQTLRNLRRAVQNKRRGQLTSKILFLHDNARPDTANCTQELLNSFKWEVFPHPPYSSDVAPSDFHLFPKMKNWLATTTTRSRGCASLSG